MSVSCSNLFKLFLYFMQIIHWKWKSYWLEGTAEYWKNNSIQFPLLKSGIKNAKNIYFAKCLNNLVKLITYWEFNAPDFFYNTMSLFACDWNCSKIHMTKISLFGLESSSYLLFPAPMFVEGFCKPLCIVDYFRADRVEMPVTYCVQI